MSSRNREMEAVSSALRPGEGRRQSGLSAGRRPRSELGRSRPAAAGPALSACPPRPCRGQSQPTLQAEEPRLVASEGQTWEGAQSINVKSFLLRAKSAVPLCGPRAPVLCHWATLPNFSEPPLPCLEQTLNKDIAFQSGGSYVNHGCTITISVHFHQSLECVNE